jgi:hypothetical protein
MIDPRQNDWQSGQFVNFTPHSVGFVFLREDGEISHVANFPPSGVVARLATTIEDAPPVIDREGGPDEYAMPAVRVTHGDLEGLPDPDDLGTTWIVSLLCLAGAKGRTDVIAPDTGPDSVVRAPDGQIIGVRRWVRP